jgi:hypothetical protein
MPDVTNLNGLDLDPNRVSINRIVGIPEKRRSDRYQIAMSSRCASEGGDRIVPPRLTYR